jgi:hypothetical protein
LHLFLIPLERMSGDSQMIFVLGKHTPFAAGAKRRHRGQKIDLSLKKRWWDAALRRVGSALTAVARRADASRPAYVRRCVKQHAQATRVGNMHVTAQRLAHG